jgi:hypothetical protein
MASFGRPLDTQSNLSVTQSHIEESAQATQLIQPEDRSIPMLGSMQKATIRVAKASPSLFAANDVNTIGNGLSSARILSTRRVQ